MTTYNETSRGRGIRCDNTVILCNSDEYYCDGSVVLRETSKGSATYAETSHTSTTYNDVSYS